MKPPTSASLSFTRTRPRSASPMMRAAQALRQQLSRPGFQSTDPPGAGTTTAPPNAALSQLLYMGTREACAEAARASMARVAAPAPEGAQVREPRPRPAEGPTSCSGRGWPGELRRQVAAERDPRAEDFFDRLARAEARDQAARIAIEAALTTSVNAPTSPSAGRSGRWSLGRLSSPVDIRPGGAAGQDEEQPRSTSPMLRAVQALQRRFGSPGRQRTVETGARATTSAAAAAYHVGTREASDAETAPSLSTEAVSSREVAPAAKPEPTPTEATQKNLQGSSSLEADGALRLTSSARKLTVKSKSFWETRENGSKSEQGEPTSSPPADYPPNVTAQSVRSADLPIGSRLKQHRRAAQAHRRRAS